MRRRPASSGLPECVALAMQSASSASPTMVPLPVFRPTRFNSSNPDGKALTTAAGAEQPKPTGAESTIEYILFAVFGTLIILALVAIYTIYSPRHREVPNRIADGLKQDRVNILLFGIGGDNHPRHDQLADS